MGWLALVVTAAIGASACGVKAGSDASFAAASHGQVVQPTGSAPGGASTTTITPGATTSVPPVSVPDGYQIVDRPGIHVTFEVPLSWAVSDVDPKNMTAAQTSLLDANPALAGLLAGGTGAYAGASLVSAVGPVDAGGNQTAFAAQLRLSLPSLPAAFGLAIKAELENAGAKNVSTASVPVRGLSADKTALRIDLTIPINGRDVSMHELLVPTTAGIAVLAVRAGDAISARIFASVTVR